MRILIFGAPGVGKGTQAKVIAAKMDIPHISTGDMLREAVKNKTEYGEKAATFMNNGDLVPDEIIAGIIKERLQNPDCEKGFILDGVPRTIYQAELLDKIFVNIDCGDLYLIKINAADEVIIERLSNRRLCNACGNIINLADLKDADKCPQCGKEGSLIKRKDDEEEVIKNRLDVYRELTEPVLGYYKDKANTIEVDGTQAVEKVTEDIMAGLK